jgi:hypothetical protein
MYLSLGPRWLKIYYILIISFLIKIEVNIIRWGFGIDSSYLNNSIKLDLAKFYTGPA